jgi:hypothetical protein
LLPYVASFPSDTFFIYTENFMDINVEIVYSIVEAPPPLPLNEKLSIAPPPGRQLTPVNTANAENCGLVNTTIEAFVFLNDVVSGIDLYYAPLKVRNSSPRAALLHFDSNSGKAFDCILFVFPGVINLAFSLLFAQVPLCADPPCPASPYVPIGVRLGVNPSPVPLKVRLVGDGVESTQETIAVGDLR